MQPDDRHRLRHLTDAAAKAVAYSSDKRRSDLDDDELLRLALTKLVEIVGEAAKNISPATQVSLPAVPWRAAARTRDRLVHHYFDINLDILWQTVTRPARAARRTTGPDSGGLRSRFVTRPPVPVSPLLGVERAAAEPQAFDLHVQVCTRPSRVHQFISLTTLDTGRLRRTLSAEYLRPPDTAAAEARGRDWGW